MLKKSKGAELVEAHSKYYLYILRGPKNHLYVGVTSNLDKRILRHKLGAGAEFTFRNKANKVVYTEEFQTLLEARRRESQAVDLGIWASRQALCKLSPFFK